MPKYDYESWRNEVKYGIKIHPEYDPVNHKYGEHALDKGESPVYRIFVNDEDYEVNLSFMTNDKEKIIDALNDMYRRQELDKSRERARANKKESESLQKIWDLYKRSGDFHDFIGE